MATGGENVERTVSKQISGFAGMKGLRTVQACSVRQAPTRSSQQDSISNSELYDNTSAAASESRERSLKLKVMEIYAAGLFVNSGGRASQMND